MRKISIIFLIVNLILCLYFVDIWSNAQNNSRGLPIVSFFESGNLHFDKYQNKTGDKCIVNNHVYSDKAPFPTFVVLPFYGVLYKLNVFKANRVEESFILTYVLGGLLCGVLPFFLIIWLTFKNVLKTKITKLHFNEIMLVMLPWYGSFLFVFSGTFFGHLFAGSIMLCAYIMLKKQNYLFCGFLAGLSVASEYTLAVIPTIWAIQLIVKEKKIKQIILLILGSSPSILFILVYNYFITGNALEFPYKFVSDDYVAMKTNFGFAHPTFDSLFGLSFSLYRGIFVYMPFLLLVLYTFLKNVTKYSLKHYLLNPVVLPSIIYFIIISSYFMWWGGWTYGPRHLTAIAIIICYEAIPYIIKNGYNKIVFWILIFIGFATAFIAKITLQYSLPSEFKNPLFDLIFPEFFKGNFNNNNVLSLLFGLNNGTSAIIWIVLFFIGILLIKYVSKMPAKINISKKQ